MTRIIATAGIGFGLGMLAAAVLFAISRGARHDPLRPVDP
jgi:hypothetical protein